MKKFLGLFAVLAFGAQVSFAAAPQAAGTPPAQANISAVNNVRKCSDPACGGEVKFIDRALKCEKCGKLWVAGS